MDYGCLYGGEKKVMHVTNPPLVCIYLPKCGCPFEFIAFICRKKMVQCNFLPASAEWNLHEGAATAQTGAGATGADLPASRSRQAQHPPAHAAPPTLPRWGALPALLSRQQWQRCHAAPWPEGESHGITPSDVAFFLCLWMFSGYIIRRRAECTWRICFHVAVFIRCLNVHRPFLCLILNCNSCNKYDGSLGVVDSFWLRCLAKESTV